MIRTYQSALEYARKKAREEEAQEPQKRSSIIPTARVLKDRTVEFIRIRRNCVGST